VPLILSADEYELKGFQGLGLREYISTSGDDVLKARTIRFPKHCLNVSMLWACKIYVARCFVWL
jgi:hypothetical protein